MQGPRDTCAAKVTSLKPGLWLAVDLPLKSRPGFPQGFPCRCQFCRGRGRKKAGGDAATLGWDWDQQRGVIAKGLSGVAEVDLVRLWQPEPVEDAFVQRWLQTVRQLMIGWPLRCQQLTASELLSVCCIVDSK